VVCGDPVIAAEPPGYGERIVEALHAAPNIDYLGQVSQEKAHRIISDAAALLSTSDSEGFPNTFLQAWASGTPVVSLKVDPGRIIQQRGLGVVSGSPERAASDLRALILAPHLREEISCRAQKYVAQTHSEDVVTRAFERAIASVSP
jgi:glycosyltransferase involved in cell wall biosynthesis